MSGAASMHNYFARFMCAKDAVQRPSEASVHTAHTAPCGGRSADNTHIVPQRSEWSMTRNPHTIASSSLAACSRTSDQNGYAGTVVVDGARRDDETACTDTDTARAGASSSSTSTATHTVTTRERQSDSVESGLTTFHTSAQNTSSTNTPAAGGQYSEASWHTIANHTRDSHNESDDDEEELSLLLGKDEAQRVRAAQMSSGRVATVSVKNNITAAAAATTANHAEVSGGMSTHTRVAESDISSAATSVVLSTLAWGSHSNRTAQTHAELFQRQFFYELQHDTALRSCFTPFLRDRVLRRLPTKLTGDISHSNKHYSNNKGDEDDSSLTYSSDRNLSCTVGSAAAAAAAAAVPPIHPAPQLTMSDIHALPGCTLRHYQLDGVQFLLDHFHRAISCILSDDMGLGKTAQVCAFLQLLQHQHGISGPHLIVAPLSTLTSWTRELNRWAPHLRTVRHHGQLRCRYDPRRRHGHVGQHHTVFVTTPAVLNQDRGFLCRKHWVVAVMDEAHVLKGYHTRIVSTARKLSACMRIAVTGTPIHNKVREVWSLLQFLYPDCVAGYDHSTRNDVVGGRGVVHATKPAPASRQSRTGHASSVQHQPPQDEPCRAREDAAEPDGTVLRSRAVEDCARLLHRIMLRRTKESVELGIPPRIDEPVVMLQPTYVQSQLLARLSAHTFDGPATRIASSRRSNSSNEDRDTNDSSSCAHRAPPLLNDKDEYEDGHSTTAQLSISNPAGTSASAASTSTPAMDRTADIASPVSASTRLLRTHMMHQRVVCNHPLTLPLLALESKAHQDDGGTDCVTAVQRRLRSCGIPFTAHALVAPSAKMRYLDTLLPCLHAQGHRCLIFSNFTSTLDLLQSYCLLRGWSCERLDGQCNRVERELAILRFNHARSRCFVFLVTTTAGGVGVTLTGADVVILFDAHYNPQMDRQAADRAHRIGQTRPVHVYRLCLHDTLEEDIRAIAERKAELGNYIVDGGSRLQSRKRNVHARDDVVTSSNTNDQDTEEDAIRARNDKRTCRTMDAVDSNECEADSLSVDQMRDLLLRRESQRVARDFASASARVSCAQDSSPCGEGEGHSRAREDALVGYLLAMEMHRDEVHSSTRLEKILSQQPAPPQAPHVERQHHEEQRREESQTKRTVAVSSSSSCASPPHVGTNSRAHECDTRDTVHKHTDAKDVHAAHRVESSSVVYVDSSRSSSRDENGIVIGDMDSSSISDGATPPRTVLPVREDEQHDDAQAHDSSDHFCDGSNSVHAADGDTHDDTDRNKSKDNGGAGKLSMTPAAAAASALMQDTATGTDKTRGLPTPPKRCFVCAKPMHDMEPLYHCIACPKSYHGECVNEPRPRPGQSTRRMWSCLRHVCCVCDKAQVVDGALFLCTSCPRSYCFDCLDSRLLELDAGGLELQRIARSYTDANVAECAQWELRRRSCYYMTCLRCTRELVSSSSSSESDADDDDDADADAKESEGTTSGDSECENTNDTTSATRVTSCTDAEVMTNDTSDSDVGVA